MNLKCHLIYVENEIEHEKWKMEMFEIENTKYDFAIKKNQCKSIEI